MVSFLNVVDKKKRGFSDVFLQNTIAHWYVTSDPLTNQWSANYVVQRKEKNYEV